MRLKSTPVRIGIMLVIITALIVLWASVTTRKINAETTVQPRPYVIATILSHEDGTGFGTPAAPWLTQKNGFPVGDEGPHDGVVTTGDTVHYRVRLAFQAAKARDVTVSIAGSKYLTKAAGDTCPSGVNVTGKTSGSGCTYSIPAGVAESVDIDLYMTAGDTAGKTVTGIKPELRLARSGGAIDSLQLGALTIVSARNADLVVDNGALSGEEDFPYACEVDSSMPGKFALRVVPLKRQGYTTTHGSSTRFPWQAVADVSAWPASTVWHWGGMTGTLLTPVRGMLHLPQATGDATLYYSVPTKDVTVGEHVYDIHVIVQSGFPQGQPGDKAPRDASTYDKNLGSSDGRPYVNDDWSRVQLMREKYCGRKTPVTDGDKLSLRYSNREGVTLWDAGNLEPPFNMKSSFAVVVDQPNMALTVGVGAKLQAEVDMSRLHNDVDYDRWSFDKGLEFTSLPVVTDNNGNVISPGPDTYTIRYGTDVDAGKDGSRIWFDDPKLTDTPPADLSTIRVVCVHHHSIIGKMNWNLKATGEGVNQISGLGAPLEGHRDYLIHYGTVTVKKPGLWTVSDNTKDTSAEHYDTVTTTIAPRLIDVPSSTLDMTADLNVCASNGLARTHISGSGWTFTQITETGCESAWTAHWAGRPNMLTISGDGTLPSLEVIGIVKPTATSAQTVSVNGTVSSKEQGDIKARTQNLVATRAITVTAPAKAASSISDNLYRDQTKEAGTVDPGSAVDMRSTLYVHGPQATGPASMVIQLPNKADKALVDDGKGPDGTWHEYNRGSSTMTVTLAGEPVIDTDLSVGQATLQYSTDSTMSLDPAKRTWQGAAAITDWSKVTAILVTATPDKAGGTSAASVSFSEKMPGGNSGYTDTWVSAPYVNDKALTGTPWPEWLQQKFGSISGHLFDDVNGNGKFDDGEDQTVDQSWNLYLTVYKSDEHGIKGDRVSGAWANSKSPGYRATRLTSGWWLVETSIDPSKPNSRDTLGYGTTYYGNPDGLEATTPTTRLIQLGVGHDYSGVDFGVHADKPRVTVRQSTQRDDCAKDTCKVTVNTTIRNAGSRKLFSDQAVLHSRTKQTVSEDDVIWNETRFKSIRGHTAIDKEGHVWAAGRVYTGSEESVWQRVPTLKDIVSAAVDFDNIVYALDSQGRLLAVRSSGNKVWFDDGIVEKYEGNVAVINKPEGVTKWVDLSMTLYPGMLRSILLEDQDGNIWTWTDVGLRVGRFFKASPDGVTFDLSKDVSFIQHIIPGSDGKLYICGPNHGGTFFYNFMSHDEVVSALTKLTPLPLDYTGGPDYITDITATFTLSDEENFAVRDANGGLWLLWATIQDGQGGNPPTMQTHWKRVDTHGVTVTRLVTHYAGVETPVYFLDNQGNTWRYNPVWITPEGGKVHYDYSDTNDVNGQWGAPGKTEYPDTLTRVASAWTFTTLEDVNVDDMLQTYVGLTEEGRPITWGSAPQSIQGVDQFDSTPSDHSADATQHVSAITPIATTTADGWITNDYAMPYDLAPGDEYTLRRTFTVPKGKEATVMAVQSWFDSPDTPYSGIKSHRDDNLDKPTLPDPTQLGEYWEYGNLNGNASCLMGGHLFSGYESSKLEDSCEQTAARIPATSTTPVIGYISGLAWRDVNKDGLRQANEPFMPFVHVTLRTKDGDTAGRTVTDGNGNYKFDGLAAGEYIAWFTTSDNHLTWTTRLNTNPAAADNDSDVSTGKDDWGSTSTLTINAEKPNWNVDAGLAIRPERNFPLTGRTSVIILVALLSVLCLGVALARRNQGKNLIHSES